MLAASLGFPPLQHIPETGVHLPGVYLTPYVPPAGFGYPLGGLLLPNPLRLIQTQAFLGSPPTEFCSLTGAVSLSRPFCSLTADVVSPKQLVTRFQSLAPPSEPHSPIRLLHLSGSRSSLGVCISEAFIHLATVTPFGVHPLVHFMRRPFDRALYFRVSSGPAASEPM